MWELFMSDSLGHSLHLEKCHIKIFKRLLLPQAITFVAICHILNIYGTSKILALSWYHLAKGQSEHQGLGIIWREVNQNTKVLSPLA